MTPREYINSGILEMYVMGLASPGEQEEVERWAGAHSEIRQEIDSISDTLENYARACAVEPRPIVKTFLMATIDYSDRLQKGEPLSFPPVLHENTSIEAFATWLCRPDLAPPDSSQDNLYAKIIGYTPEMTTALVWIKHDTPREIHHTEHERFLIIEGSCDIFVGDTCTHLGPGDYFSIPLHEYHYVKVTSSGRCKAILQRVAA